MKSRENSGWMEPYCPPDPLGMPGPRFDHLVMISEINFFWALTITHLRKKIKIVRPGQKMTPSRS